MKAFKKKFSENSFVICWSVASWIILIAILYFFPVEFSSYKNTDRLAPVWHLITMTGGAIGVSIILPGIFVYLHYKFRNKTRKLKSAYSFTLIILLVELLIAGSTLYFVKNIFKNPRPSQLYLSEKGNINLDGKEFLDMVPEEKMKIIRSKIDDNNILSEIYPPILDSWINDSGYSFPSGHSETAFFLGTVLSFIIFKTSSKKFYSLIPFVWAVAVCLSRVVIGIHFPFDVAAGALIGLAASNILIALPGVNDFFSNH